MHRAVASVPLRALVALASCRSKPPREQLITASTSNPVIPAQAGIQDRSAGGMDSCFRRNDGMDGKTFSIVVQASYLLAPRFIAGITMIAYPWTCVFD